MVLNSPEDAYSNSGSESGVTVCVMASFAPAQAEIRSKWGELVETSALGMASDVSSGVKSVVGWLKQASLEVREAGRRRLNAAMSHSQQLTIIHYNDVYNVEARNIEPCGGAARFATKVKSFSHLDPLVLFSGDVFNPSMLSSFTKGEHMSYVLNEIGTHCSVFGNHDFDFGLEVLSERVGETNFPWLMSNVIDNETGRPLGDGKISHVVHWAGKTIGLIGLVEKEWLDTLATINPEEVTFMDFVEVGSKLGAQLKQEGCEMVIALTHMRNPNDIKLAESCDQIDLILGGHDHIYYVNKVNGRYIVKSGTDFRQMSKITVKFEREGLEFNIEQVDITKDVPDDPNMKEHLDKYTSVMEGKMGEVLGEFSVELDGRFDSIRRKETNLGNWVCDVILSATDADLVMLNSGTLRSDRIHPAGPFTMGDLTNVIPMMDPIVVLQVSGEAVLSALENAVSQWPKLEGRFAQVAGVSFAFDPDKEPGNRVPPELVRIGDEYLSRTADYRLATKTYLASGCDGFNVFKSCKVLVDEDGCPELGLAIQNHFESIRMKQGKTKRNSRHRQSLITLSRRHSLVKMLESFDEGSRVGGASPGAVGKTEPKQSHAHPPKPAMLTRRTSIDDLEYETCLLAPKVEGRIIQLNSRLYQEMLTERDRHEQSLVIQEVDEIESPKSD